MHFVEAKARAHDPDPEHNEIVTRLALELFEGLRGLHGYGPEERRLLEIAGRLHDIGWSQVVSGKHHKISGRLIRDLAIPGVDKKELAMISLIARFHSKSMPDPKRHRRFAALDADARERVEWLAAVLRVADGLDNRHLRVVKGASCAVGRKTIRIRLDASGDCRAEVERAGEKQDLLERVSERKIRYLC
ncbi:MAG TPA: HD domain-containing protein [Thermodesulfobacteriota bacterium]|nr:HD domain-containing protein [Thermodesulfobacteriota bacterium]